MEQTCRLICDILHAGNILSRTTALRVARYVDAMGSLTCMSGDLVLLGILQSETGSRTVSELVNVLGLLQPTVSMSVAALEGEGLVMRLRQDEGATRSVDIVLTEAGETRAADIADEIRALVIRRKS